MILSLAGHRFTIGPLAPGTTPLPSSNGNDNYRMPSPDANICWMAISGSLPVVLSVAENSKGSR